MNPDTPPLPKSPPPNGMFAAMVRAMPDAQLLELFAVLTKERERRGLPAPSIEPAHLDS